jgi:hypothetical protein
VIIYVIYGSLVLEHALVVVFCICCVAPLLLGAYRMLLPFVVLQMDQQWAANLISISGGAFWLLN